MNTTKHAFLAICAFACLASLAADVTYEGRLVDASGIVQSNATLTNATLRAYATEDATESFCTNAISIFTDAEGYFAATASISVPTNLQSFWIGVTPDDGDEIRPRMQILPAPFAIVAATAELLESDEPLEFNSGTLFANTIASNATVTSTNATFQGKNTLCGGVQGAAKIYIRDLDPGDGHLSILRTENLDGITSDFSSFVYDEELKVTASVPVSRYSNSKEITAEDDGFAIVALQVRKITDNDGLLRYFALATIGNGDFVIGEHVNFCKWIKVSGTKHYFFTVPVRKGNIVTVGLECHFSDSTAAIIARQVQAHAKIKMFYFGAK